MPAALKVGDSVKLNSGGPVMTVIDVTASGMVTCKWSFNNGFKTERFPSDALSVAL